MERTADLSDGGAIGVALKVVPRRKREVENNGVVGG